MRVRISGRGKTRSQRRKEGLDPWVVAGLGVVHHPMVEAQVVAGHDKREEKVKGKGKVLVVVGIWWSWMFR